MSPGRSLRYRRAVATSPRPDVTLNPVQGDPTTLEDLVTTFHLVTVVLDPYTYESSWLIDTAGRILENFTGADVRVAFVVTDADQDKAIEYMGPWAERLLVFSDPDRAFVRALELETLPALVHLDHGLNLVGVAEGWDPNTWSPVIDSLAKVMSWSRPLMRTTGDPTAYEGTPALP